MLLEVCKFDKGACYVGASRCDRCGFNPEVAERRIEKLRKRWADELPEKEGWRCHEKG